MISGRTSEKSMEVLQGFLKTFHEIFLMESQKPFLDENPLTELGRIFEVSSVGFVNKFLDEFSQNSMK